MLDHGLTDAQLEVALAATRAVAAADGTIDEHERALLEATARALGFARSIDDLPSVTPEALAATIVDSTTRTRVVQAMILIALMNGEVETSEHDVIRAYAKALGVDEPRLRNLDQLAHGHTKFVYLDLWRRSTYLGDAVRAAKQKKGLRGVWQFFAGLKGHATDPGTAWRFKKLGLLPEGSFGREYWAHMTTRGFAFPGEHLGFPEELVKHDLAHVLGDYETDAVGECEVIAFIAGYFKSDPFSYLFMMFVHMQLGVLVFDGSPVEHLIVPADRVVRAFERGAQVTADLYDPKWDFWADFPLPLEEVRRKYGITVA